MDWERDLNLSQKCFMNSSEESIKNNDSDIHDKEIRWIDFPLKQRPITHTILLIIIILFISIGLSYATESLWWGIIAVTFLTISLGNYFFPTVYTINLDGISYRILFYKRQKQWKNIRNIITVSNGIMFSPFIHKTRLENYRGIFVRANKERRNIILDFIEKYNCKKKL